MKIRLHKNATTTPAQRAYIQNNPQLSVASLAKKTGVSKTTIRRWQKRTDVYDRPHTPKRIKTALSPIEEIKIIICRMAFRQAWMICFKFPTLFLRSNVPGQASTDASGDIKYPE